MRLVEDAPARRQDFLDVPAEELDAGVAEQVCERRVDLQDRPVVREREEAARRGIENGIGQIQLTERYSRIAWIVSSG